MLWDLFPEAGNWGFWAAWGGLKCLFICLLWFKCIFFVDHLDPRGINLFAAGCMKCLSIAIDFSIFDLPPISIMRRSYVLLNLDRG